MNDVVYLTYPEPEIAIITIEDRVNHNTITEQLQRGIVKAFADIEANPNVKVVITHGYENYYVCGGDKEGLLELSKGVKTYADFPFFTLPCTCKVPTIAAVQGHAIGGGLAFACMHDFIFLATGVIYSANFMKYGFTPGMCSTYTIPKRFGANCGHHMLFTARQYDWEELQELHCLLPFYPKNEVIEQALQLAKDISNKTATSVKLLKEQLSFETRLELPKVIKNEVAMHAKTITSEEAISRIKAEFDN